MTHIFPVKAGKQPGTQGAPKPDFLTFIEKSEYSFRKMGIQHPLQRKVQNSASTIQIGGQIHHSASLEGVYSQ